MGTLTITTVFSADDQAEYEAAVARLDAYQADPGNHPLSSRTDDPQALTVTYTAVGEQTPT